MSGDAVEAPRQSCAHCGRDLRQEARFCPGCGQAVAEPRPERRPAWPDAGGYGTAGDTRAIGPVPGRYPAGDAPPDEPGPPFGTSPPFSTSPEPWHPDGRRRRRPLTLSLVGVLVVAGIVAVALLILRPSHGGPAADTAHSGAAAGPSAQAAASAGASDSAGASASTGASASATSTLPAQQQAANALAALLAQSVTDRSAIAGSVSDVNQCGTTLSQDAQTFDNAATSRQNLLSQLAGLPARTALPASMLQDLTQAWQASAAVDQDLSQWAQDESSGGCTPNDHADPHFQAATGPDHQATSAKKAFVSQWNPIASGYGLASYQANQL